MPVIDVWPALQQHKNQIFASQLLLQAQPSAPSCSWQVVYDSLDSRYNAAWLPRISDAPNSRVRLERGIPRRHMEQGAATAAAWLEALGGPPLHLGPGC